jgi:MFS family permease
MQLIEKLRGAKYELIAFTTGAAVMMLEMVGARLIAPYFGASTYVWTAMIGVILGALAAGYYLGGKLADRDHRPADVLGLILAGAAILVLSASFMHETVLGLLATTRMDLRLGALLAGIVLFVPPSLLIGMVGPHLAKIRVTSLKTTGQSIGRLEAWSALGSIAGTFLCGYWLLGFLGSRNITLLLVIVLILTSLLAERRLFQWTRLAIAVSALILIISPKVDAADVIADVDSSYARYRIVKGLRENRPTTSMLTDSYSIQSQAYVGSPGELPLVYTQRFLEAALEFPDLQNVMVIGGGMHTFPTALHLQRPDTSITIVEIDPALDELARKYFAYDPSEKLQAVYQDGRAYLNVNSLDNDLIFVDAFSSLTPPFQLTTEEAVGRMQENLHENGAVIVNAIGSQGGEHDEFIHAIFATYASTFKFVKLYQANTEFELSDRQNFILSATNSKQSNKIIHTTYKNLPTVTPAPASSLTDDFAPIERLNY